jgi:hypothetical protein
MRFSMPVRVSLPEPPVACAPEGEADADAAAADAVEVADGVVAAGTVEEVVAAAGVEEVVEGVAGEVGGAGGEDAAVLDVGAEGVGGEVAEDLVGAAGGRDWRWSR